MTGYIEEGKSMGKAVIFDLDGTLLNTLDDLEDSVNHTLNYFKYPKRTKAEVRSFIGGGAKALIKKSLSENVTAEKYEEVLSYFQAYYKKNADKKTGIYPGVKKLVNKLSDENYSIGVVSAKGDIVVKELVESFLGDKVNETLGEKEGIKRKPAPDSILIMMDTQNANQKKLFTLETLKWMWKQPPMRELNALLSHGDSAIRKTLRRLIHCI